MEEGVEHLACEEHDEGVARADELEKLEAMRERAYALYEGFVVFQEFLEELGGAQGKIE